MIKKEGRTPKANPSQIVGLGIPTFNRAEKLSEVIPIKVGSTLKKAIPKPRSTWVRRIIIKELERETEETG